jgi:hypothetical protein
MLMSLIYSLTGGDGCLRDVDRLSADDTRQGLLGLPEVQYTPIHSDGTEEAALITHRPSGWGRAESYLVIRSWWDGAQRLLHPHDLHSGLPH